MEAYGTMTAIITKIEAAAALLSGVQEDSQQLDAILEEIQALAGRARDQIEDTASRLANDIFRREFKGRTEVNLSVFVETLHPSDTNGLRSNLRVGMQAGILPGIKKDDRWYVTPATLAAWFRRIGASTNRQRKPCLAA